MRKGITVWYTCNYDVMEFSAFVLFGLAMGLFPVANDGILWNWNWSADVPLDADTGILCTAIFSHVFYPSANLRCLGCMRRCRRQSVAETLLEGWFVVRLIFGWFQDDLHTLLGGWFQSSFIFPLTLGDDPIWLLLFFLCKVQYSIQLMVSLWFRFLKCPFMKGIGLGCLGAPCLFPQWAKPASTCLSNWDSRTLLPPGLGRNKGEGWQ